MIKETVTKAVITGVIGGLIAISGVQLFIVPQLKAKDLSVSDELVRIEKRVDVHEQALKEIINFLSQASQPKN
jgi:hypothetical protein